MKMLGCKSFYTNHAIFSSSPASGIAGGRDNATIQCDDDPGENAMDSEDSKKQQSARIFKEADRTTGRLIGYGFTALLLIAALILLFLYVL